MPSPIATRKPFRFKRIVVLVVGTALLGYFAYHAVEGSHGLKASIVNEKKLEKLAGELKRLKAVSAKLDRNILLLRPENLDPDLLEERARALLNFAKPGELTILRDLRP